MPLRSIMPYVRREDIQPKCLVDVKDFLLKSFSGKGAIWPNYHCTIWMDGLPRKVVGGSYYQIYSNDIYVSHEDDAVIPDWGPGALIAIAVFFKLHQDADIRFAAVDLLARTIAGIVLPYQRMLAETFTGRELDQMAINSATKELAAKVYDEAGQGRWVMPDGIEIDFNTNEDWHGFAVPVGRS